jgi:hypothetical protein
MGLTKAQLEALNDSSFPNNNVGAITPEILRNYNDEVILNTVNQDVYTADSASFSSRINSISGSGGTVNTGSLVTTASFNAYTASTNSEISAIESFTASVSTSVGLLQTFSSSQYKNDSSSFDNRINAITASGGGVSVGTFNSYTASQDFKNTTFATTSSLSDLSGSIFSTDATQSSLINGKLDTSSFNTFSTSVDSRINAITGSSINTASFATTGSNVFIGNQTISGSLFISGSEVVAGPVTASKLQINGITDLNGTLDVNNDATFRGDVYIQSSGNPKLRIRDTAGGGGSDGFDIGISTSSFVIKDDTHDFNFFEFDYDGSFEHVLKLRANKFELLSGSVSIEGGITASNDISTSGNIYAANLTGSGGTIDTGSFATTGSNTFVGNQTITGNVTISGSATSDLTVVGQIFVSSSATAQATQPRIIVSGSLGQTTILRNNVNTTNGSRSSGVTPNVIFNSDSATADEIGFAVSPSSAFLSGWTTGPAIYVNNTAGDTYPAVFGFQNKANYTDGRVAVLTPLSASAGITSSDAFINNELYSVTSASFDSRINSVSGQSQIQDEGTILGNVTSFNFIGDGVTATVSSGTASVTIPGGGGTIDTSSFATTGSNTFVGNQTITGSLLISSSATTDLTVVGQIYVSSSATGQTTQPRIIVSGSAGQTTILRNNVNTNNGTNSAGLNPTAIFNSVLATGDEIGFSVNAAGGGIGGWTTGPAIYVNNDAGDTYPAALGFQNKANYTDGRVTVLTPLQANSDITTSKILVTDTGTTAIQYQQQSTGSVAGVYATSYGKDNIKVYQYQGQPYAFNVNLTANQLNAYTGSEFQWALQLNGSNVSLPGGGGVYFSMASGSTTGSGEAGQDKKGLNYLGTSMILDMYADTSFRRKVYVEGGMYVSGAAGGSTPALIIDGSSVGNRAIQATGSVDITGSLTVNGTTVGAVGYGSYYTTTTNSGSVLTFLTQESAVGFENVSGSFMRTTQSGMFLVTANVDIDNAASTGTSEISLKKNGSTITGTTFTAWFANTSAKGGATSTAIVQLNQNDYIEVGLGLGTSDTVTAGRVSITKIA